MDAMVLATQQFLNATYGNNPAYNLVSETGNTGWPTIYALTRALQIELGITSTADNFGPTTERLFQQKFGNGISQQPEEDPAESNVYAIIQGALWCKGYRAHFGGITKHFYAETAVGVVSMKRDAGLTDADSLVTLDCMKALLSMNQYVRVSGGSDKIRKVQQRLNRTYLDYVGLAPCDGLYGREMNQALIKVLQAIEGLSPSEATGYFGSMTKANCPLLPNTGGLTANQAAEATLLLRAALCCNGYTDVDTSMSTWDSKLEAQLRTFQADMALSQTGKGDVNTWMSLLLSSGNPDRAASVCDTRFEMTPGRIQQLQKMGYKAVGRYLTGSDFKVLRPEEPLRILSNGMGFFPIFQESATDLSYFTPERGKQDAHNATRAAYNFGIPENEIIYFAVDTDPQQGQITSTIVPYFKAIAENIGSYRAGVYGTRNVCINLEQKGYTAASFVGDMSTGFSGNMGFKMPGNWTLDQFHEISLEPDWGIDKVACSPRFAPVTRLEPRSSYTKPAVPAVPAGAPTILSWMDKFRQLETLYTAYWHDQWEHELGPLDAAQLVMGITDFLRSDAYNSPVWTLALGPVDNGFVSYVKHRNSMLYQEIFPYIKYNREDNYRLTEGINGIIDLAHLGATILGYLPGSPAPDFWFGWGGDLATGMADTQKYIESHPGTTAREAACIVIGREESQCNYSDFCCDADAFKIAQHILSGSQSAATAFSDTLTWYYTSMVQKRFSYFIEEIGWSGSLASLQFNIAKKMNIGLEQLAFLLLFAENATDETKVACCEAFGHYIYQSAVF